MFNFTVFKHSAIIFKHPEKIILKHPEKIIFKNSDIIFAKWRKHGFMHIDGYVEVHYCHIIIVTHLVKPALKEIGRENDTFCLLGFFSVLLLSLLLFC